MLQQKKQLAGDSIVKALQVRKKLQLKFDESISALDVAERLGIEVRLEKFPSMEGMYVGGSRPTIILSSQRPQGRRNFTCGHEIGHHVMGHGEQFDELIKERSFSRSSAPKEFQADCFSAFLLMPKATVENGLSKRGYKYETLTELQAFSLSCWLGVSYGGFVNHLVYGLATISKARGAQLTETPPFAIRRQLFGAECASDLLIVDEHWTGRAIDCEVGDYLLLPSGVILEGTSIINVGSVNQKSLIQAKEPGVARLSMGLWSSFVRVSSDEFTGRACYRFEEKVNDDY
jgi:hypothetical protein